MRGLVASCYQVPATEEVYRVRGKSPLAQIRYHSSHQKVRNNGANGGFYFACVRRLLKKNIAACEVPRRKALESFQGVGARTQIFNERKL